MDNIISVQYPEVALVKQKLHKSATPDVPDTVLESLKSLPLEDRIKPGQTVAVSIQSYSSPKEMKEALELLTSMGFSVEVKP